MCDNEILIKIINEEDNSNFFNFDFNEITF